MIRARISKSLRRCARGGARLGWFGRLGERGAAAVEFALFSPVMVLMALGVYEYSRWASVEIELEQSLRAGAQIAMNDIDFLNGFCTRIGDAVQAATDLTPAPTELSCSPPVCRCPDGTENPTGCPGATGYTSCPGDIIPDVFVTFEFGTTYVPVFFDLPGIINNPRQELTIRIR